MTERIITITGGARSGKTRHAIQVAQAAGNPVTYLATARASDPEMIERIREHQAERPAHWRTIEEPRDLTQALRDAQLPPESVVLVDCVTVWLGGYVCPLYDLPESTALPRLAEVESEVFAQANSLLDFARRSSLNLVVVTNEVGDGIVPADPLTRFYRDTLGRLNQLFAAASHEVYLLVAGLPLRLK